MAWRIYLGLEASSFSYKYQICILVGAGLVPFQPQRVIFMIQNQPEPLPQRLRTPTEYNILDQVFEKELSTRYKYST